MALQTTGAISLSDVNVELGLSSTALVSLNDAVVRSLLNVASGTISLYDAYGKSSIISTPWTLDNVTLSPMGMFGVADVDGIPSGIFFKPDGLKMYVIGNANDRVNEYDLSTAWVINTAVYLQTFSVFAQETVPNDLFFKPDGLKMYVVGSTGDDVNEYNLSTAWNISTAVWLQTFSVATQETLPQSIFFKPDGLKMYILGQTGDDVNEYNLSTAWNISTASYVQAFSVLAQDSNSMGIFFRSDGLKMYTSGYSSRNINEYNLSTAWNVSTASYVASFDISGNDSTPQGIFFRPDGLYMYMIGSTYDKVYGYNLGTAWSVSTAVFDNPFGTYLSVIGQETAPQSLFFKPDGLKLYVIGTTGDDINEYDLSTAWDTATASYLRVGSITAQETLPTALFFKPDGLKVYVMGTTGDDVNEYNLGTAWNVSTLSFVQSFSIADLEIVPSGIFFKPDGLKMYVVGTENDSIWTYSLSTAWNVSTATIPLYGKLRLNPQETAPQSIFFKPDGLKMYVIGSTGDDVNEYNLSTAWEVSTAVYLQTKLISAQETLPTALFFKPDGLKMYVLGSTGDDVNEYNLSTAWNVSTAVYLQTKLISAQETVAAGLFFKPDGLKMYVIGSTGDDVNEYNLSTAWNVSTAVYVQNFSIVSQESVPSGVFFKPDGLKMYVIGSTGDDVNEYNLSTAWSVSTAVYVQNFSVFAQQTAPKDVFFRSDGLRMYVVGTSSATVHSYTLSTAWNISTAVWDAPADSYLNVSSESTGPTDIFFKPDGLKLFVIGNTADNIYEYNLSTAWNVSTASYVQFYSISAQSLNPSGLFFKSDGSKMYVLDSTTRDIWGYNL